MSFVILGNYPVNQWSMAYHDGETTNNRSEALNQKMSNNKKISKHPNPYLWAKEVKSLMKESLMDAYAAQAGNRNVKNVKKKGTKFLAKRRKDLTERLENHEIPLLSFQQSIGGSLSQLSKEIHRDEEDSFFNREEVWDGGDLSIEIPNIEDIVVNGLSVPQQPVSGDSNHEQVRDSNFGLSLNSQNSSRYIIKLINLVLSAFDNYFYIRVLMPSVSDSNLGLSVNPPTSSRYVCHH